MGAARIHQPFDAANSTTAAPALSAAATRRRATRRRSTQQRRAAYQFGAHAEAAVGLMLHSAGYAILTQRERICGAEVDIVAARDDVVAFVEVKARKRGYDGLEAVDQRKRRKLTRASQEWLSRNPGFSHCSIRFDIALVWPTGLPEYIENAFEAEGDFVF